MLKIIEFLRERPRNADRSRPWFCSIEAKSCDEARKLFDEAMPSEDSNNFMVLETQRLHQYRKIHFIFYLRFPTSDLIRRSMVTAYTLRGAIEEMKRKGEIEQWTEVHWICDRQEEGLATKEFALWREQADQFIYSEEHFKMLPYFKTIKW